MERLKLIERVDNRTTGGSRWAAYMERNERMMEHYLQLKEDYPDAYKIDILRTVAKHYHTTEPNVRRIMTRMGVY